MGNINDIKIEYISGNLVWSFCPFHKDKLRPNLSVSLDNEYYGRWKCWSCGRYGQLSKAKMRSLNMPKSNKRNKPISINWNKLAWNYIDNYNNNYKLATLWNVSLDSTEALLCGYDEEAYTFPMQTIIGSGLCITGIQRIWLDGKKKAVNGSQLGLFIPFDIKGGELLICEGISDTVAVYDLGFNAIGKPCATYGDNLIQEYLSMIDSIDKVIIIPDNDDAGLKSAAKLSKLIPDSKVFIFTGAKDIRDYIKLVGKEQVTKELGEYING